MVAHPFGSTLAFLSSDQTARIGSSSGWSISPLPAASGHQQGVFDRCATTARAKLCLQSAAEAP